MWVNMFHGTRSLLCARPSEVPAHAGKEPRPPGGPAGAMRELPPARPAPHRLRYSPHTCPAPAPGTCSRHHRAPAVPSSWVSLPRHLHACCLAASGVYPNAGLPVRFPAPRSLLRDPPWRRARTCGVSAYCFHVPAASPGTTPLQAADYTALFPTPARRRRISSLKPATAGRC